MIINTGAAKSICSRVAGPNPECDPVDYRKLDRKRAMCPTSGSAQRDRRRPIAQIARDRVIRQVDDVARVALDKLVAHLHDPAGDALHFALATNRRVDVLLTWNCRHFAYRVKWSIFGWLLRTGTAHAAAYTSLNF